MKTASSALQSYLAAIAVGSIGGIVNYAELYTFALTNGSTLRITTWDIDVVYGGNTYKTYAKEGGPFVKRGSINQKIGLEVPTLELDLYALPANQINGIPIIQAFRQGNFDAAQVTLIGDFLDVVGDGGFIDFFGRVGDIKCGTSSVNIKVNGMTELLNLPMPRFVFQPGCRNVYYDLNCQVSKSGKTATGTIGSGSNAMVLQTSLSPFAVIAPPTTAPTLSYNSSSNNLPARTYYAVYTYTSANGETTAGPESFIAIPKGNVVQVNSPGSATGATGWNVYLSMAPGQELLQNGIALAIGSNFIEPKTGLQAGVPPPQASSQGFYSLGVITFTSGALNGLSAGVRGNTGGTLTLNVPLPQAPGIGDTFSIVPGCKKQFQDCVQNQGSHSLAQHRFSGEPFIPKPESGI